MTTITSDERTKRKILDTARTIAVVGLSANRTKAGFTVPAYLQRAGYRIIPVNPYLEQALGEKAYPDLLSIPEPVDGVEDLDPKRYGLIVQSKENPWKRGLLLPDLEGIDTAEQQLYFTRHHKAGITDPDEPVQLFRFEVRRCT